MSPPFSRRPYGPDLGRGHRSHDGRDGRGLRWAKEVPWTRGALLETLGPSPMSNVNETEDDPEIANCFQDARVVRRASELLLRDFCPNWRRGAPYPRKTLGRPDPTPPESRRGRGRVGVEVGPRPASRPALAPTNGRRASPTLTAGRRRRAAGGASPRRASARGRRRRRSRSSGTPRRTRTHASPARLRRAGPRAATDAGAAAAVVCVHVCLSSPRHSAPGCLGPERGTRVRGTGEVRNCACVCGKEGNGKTAGKGFR